MTDQNKRTNHRTRTFLKGKVVFNNGMSTVDCLVRNMSGTGAKVEVTGSVPLPDVFELQIPQKGETVRVHLRWRRGDEVGVEFGADPGSPPENSGPEEGLEQLRELEADNARLRQLLGSLESAADGPGTFKRVNP